MAYLDKLSTNTCMLHGPWIGKACDKSNKNILPNLVWNPKRL